MRYLAALSLATLSLIANSTSRAAPVNDNIRNALPLSSETSINRIEGEIVGATDDPDVLFTLPGFTQPFYYAGYPIVWYKWEVPISGTVRTQLIGVGYAMWLITVQGTPGDAVFELTSNPTVTTVYSAVSSYSNNYDVVGGKTYYVGVLLGHALDTPARAPYDFKIAQVFRPAAISDAFASRTPIGGRKFTINGLLNNLTAEADEPQHSSTAASAARKTGWMTYTSPTRSVIKLSAESKISTPLLAVYTGDALATLTRVAQSTGGGSGTSYTSTLSFLAEAGVPYAIAVDADGTRAGPFTMKVEASTVAPGFLTKPKTTTVFQGDPAFFTATAATSGTTRYQWQHLPLGSTKWVNVQDSTEAAPTIFTGAKTNALNLSTTTLAMNRDKFRLVVTDDVASIASEAVSLLVTEFPAVQVELLGKLNFDQISTSEALPDPTNGGVYFATGLPKGLTIDPETGVISGTATAKAGTYIITYGSTNGKKRNPQQFSLVINITPLSAYLAGAFEALLLNGDAQPRPAGKLRLNVAASGAFTGNFFALDENKTYTFKGNLALDQATRSAFPVDQLPVVLSRGRGRAPLHLTFTLVEPAENSVNTYTTFSANLQVADGPFVGDAFDGIQIVTFSESAPASWAGNYTARLTTVDNFGSTPDADLPRGSGYATATIAPKTGALALRGRLAEGTAFTANLSSSGDARYLLSQRVHSGVGGSLAGPIALSPRWTDETLYHIPKYTGDRLYWIKTPDKNYPQGFGPLGIRLLMAPWSDPGADFVKRFNLSRDTAAFTVKLESAAFVNAPGNAYNLPIDLVLGATGKVSLQDPTSNPTKFKVSIDPKTGLCTGSFTITEPTIAPPAKKPAQRTMTINGVMFQDEDIFTDDIIAEGYFLVPPLAKGTPITSGLFEFRAGTTDSYFAGDDPIGLPPPVTAP